MPSQIYNKKISHSISDQDAIQCAKEYERDGKTVRYNLDGKPNKTQFFGYIQKRRYDEYKLLQMKADEVTREMEEKYCHEDLTRDQLDDIKQKFERGEISMEDYKKVLLYKYKRDPLFMCTRLFRDMTIDRALSTPDKTIYSPSPAFHQELMDLYQSHNLIAVAAPRNHAKAQSLDSKILTPDGWIELRDLKVNDFVIGADGKKKKVLYLHPIQEMDLYRVTTRDNRSTLCNADHLWNVETPSNTGDRIVTRTTKELMMNYYSERFNKTRNEYFIEFRHFIHPSKPIEFEEKNLPIDPYTFGAWLGDGHSAGARFTTADIEILNYFPYEISKGAGPYVYGILGLQKQLRENGFVNNKHIPDLYLFGSIKQRIRLLQGLMDTDGCVSSDGFQAQFTNKNKRIIDGVVTLVRSLGGTTTVSDAWTSFEKAGKKFHSFKITARLPAEVIPFRLKRKVEKWKGSVRVKSAITNIQYERTDFGRCISVEDNLYITDDFLVTHNSTLTGFFYVLHQALFHQKHNIVLVSATEDLAIRFLRDIKTEIESNKLVTWLFGPQISDKWSEKEIQLANGTRIYAKGRGGQMRGLKERGSRPDLIVVDDLEDSELVRSELRRLDLEDWFNGDVLPTLEPKIGQLIVIGTILHEDSLLNRLLNKELYPDFTTRIYSAITTDSLGESVALWPERFSLTKLEEIKTSFIARGQLSTFYMEYMNNPVPSEGASFKQEYFTFFDAIPPTSIIVKELFIDLGGGSLKKTADDTAMVVIATDTESGMMYVEDYVAERMGMDTDRIIRHIFKLADTHSIRKIYIEKTMATNMLTAALDRKMIQLRKHYNVEYVSPTRGSADRRGNMSDGKFQRIAALEAPFKLGQIKIRRWMTKLIEQLLTFPRGQHDDVIDALAMGYQFAKKKKHSSGKQFKPAHSRGYLNRTYVP